LSTIAARLALAADVPAGATRFVYKPVQRQFRAQGMHFALVAGVLAVLFVACANLGNLQLARGLDRGRELAMRASLGATRRDLIALLLTESAVIAFGGLVLGVVLSFWGIGLLQSSVPRQVAAYVISPEPSWRVFAFAGVASVACLILIGVVPAVRLSAVNLDSLLKSGAGTGAHRAHRQRYGWLLIAQIGLTLPVLTGAVLIGRATVTFADPVYRMTRVYGEDPDSIVMARLVIAAPRGAYVRMAPIVADLVHRASAVPFVSAVGVQFVASPESLGVTVAEAAGFSREVPAPAWSYSVVSPGFFRARGVPVERGRDFVDGIHEQANVIVDRSTATFLWPKQNPVGQLVKLGASRSNAPWLRVSGVSGDHLDSVGRAHRAWLDTLRLSGLYRVVTDADSVRAGSNGVSVAVFARTTRDPVLATIALRQALASVPVALPPYVAWLRDEYGASTMIIQRKFMTSIFGGAAAICLALSAFGVYAIVAQSVAQRRREIAVRCFLGATPRGILRLILREGNVYILAGVALGLLLAMRTLHWLAMLLTDEERTGVVWFASASAGVFILAALAALIPAMRATRVDPAEALRSD
jgi:predicted permease